MRRGQAAVEYLVTYGWAFLVITLVVGGLAYFGILSPQRYLPAKCDFGAQLRCTDFQLQAGVAGSDNGRILLRVQNNFNDAINITAAWNQLGTPVDLAWGADDEVFPLHGKRIAEGNGSDIITATLPEVTDESLLITGERQRAYLTFAYVRASGGPEHNLSGEIFAEVQ